MNSVIKVKKLDPRAIIPSKKNRTDEGWDLYSIETVSIPPHSVKLIKTGIAVEIPKGYWLQIEGRSGMAVKGAQPFGGIIDNDYRGPIGVVLANLSENTLNVAEGDRIAQLVVRESLALDFTFTETTDLSETERGDKGFGSSGR